MAYRFERAIVRIDDLLAKSRNTEHRPQHGLFSSNDYRENGSFANLFERTVHIPVPESDDARRMDQFETGGLRARPSNHDDIGQGGGRIAVADA